MKPTLAPTVELFSQHVADLIRSVGKQDFPAQLVAKLREMVHFEDATVIVYPSDGMPLIAYFETPKPGGVSNLGTFIKGAFLLDPYYIAAAKLRKFGVFRLHELSPPEFKDSEYYKTWYRSYGYEDECGYLMPIDNGGFVNIALGKIKSGTAFTQSECELLDAAMPVVEALCQQHWAGLGVGSESADLRSQLHQALESFGRSLLTERETQVINLVLHGHSTRTLADKLSISTETVKLHRKHAYAKLEINSQAELFYLFLDSLMSAKEYAGGDTLEAYLQPPRTPR